MTVQFNDFSDVTSASPSRGRLYSAAGKRVLDIALIVIALPVILPVAFTIILFTWLEGGRPLYVQNRVGRDGRTFRCWKIRTMVPNAEKVLAELIASNPDVAREWQSNQKLAHDPRITRLGRILRRTSLDELPQLWNVLTGSMSLIGPRPFMPDQQALYAGGNCSASYYRLRPGISGLWQVSRRNAGSFSERVNYDEQYAERISLTADMAILWYTVRVVLQATGL